MWELDYKESWAQGIDAFELWCWRRLLRVPWTARRSNQCILEEISPRYSLEGLLLKLKQYFGHLRRRADWFEKTLILGKIEGGRGDYRVWDFWMASPTQWTWVCINSGSWWWTGRPGMLWFMGSQRVRHNWSAELNWTERWYYVVVAVVVFWSPHFCSKCFLFVCFILSGLFYYLFLVSSFQQFNNNLPSGHFLYIYS